MERRVEALIANYLNSESETPGKSKLQLYQEITALIEVKAR